jgi:hypothetical protein
MFPINIFNGLTASRKDLKTKQSPDHNDWLAMVLELQATQEYVKTITSNLEFTDDLNAKFQQANVRLNELFQQVSKILPSDQLQKDVEALKLELKDVDASVDIQILQQNVVQLEQRMALQQLELGQVQRELNVEVIGFRNRLQNEFNGFKSQVSKQITELQAMLDRLNAAIGVKALLTKLNAS